MDKTAGILFAISSLPSKYGIGCFSKEAYKFVDWLVEAGQTFWQILPLGPTGYGDSPYQSFSTFAGNPYFIDLETLISEGLLTREECDSVDFGTDEQSVDYEKQYNGRYVLLRKACERSRHKNSTEYKAFLEKNETWVYDYCLYMAVKNHFGGMNWTEWPEAIHSRTEEGLREYKEKLADEIYLCNSSFSTSGISSGLTPIKKELKLSEIFRFMYHWIVQMHGRIRNCSS